MTKIIRGFSLNTGYSCQECHIKCCATDYELPLFLHETEALKQNYPFCEIFLHSTPTGDWLLRGDRCSFLNSKGMCLLHNTQIKPLICQIYPLIFWKVKSDLILAWINPCRGNGFRWISKPDNHITDHEIERLFNKSRPHFKNYIGEQIDKRNPYKKILISRFAEELTFFDNIEKSDLYSEIRKMNIIPHYLYKVLLPSKESPTGEMTAIINAVIYWLCWSPVGLQLSFNHSKMLFFIAASWVDMITRPILAQTVLPLNHDQILQQLGSFLATAILPSFWRHMALKTEYKRLKKLAKTVYKVLEGEIGQEEILRKTF
ncbi:MAG: YkgJ family cysteine cluster protein [Candidatus Thorarchaeota archaeon]